MPQRGRALVAATFVAAVGLLVLLILVPDGNLPAASKASIVNTLLLVLVLAERFLTRPPGGGGPTGIPAS